MGIPLTEIEQLRTRVESLEHKNRWLWRATLTLVAAAALGATVGGAAAPAPRVIEAEQFVVRDASGKLVASLGTDRDGSAGLAFHDPAGKPRIALGVKPDGTSGLLLDDAKGSKRAGLTAQANGKAGLSLYDERGNIRAGIALDENGAPRMAIPPTGQ